MQLISVSIYDGTYTIFSAHYDIQAFSEFGDAFPYAKRTVFGGIELALSHINRSISEKLKDTIERDVRGCMQCLRDTTGSYLSKLPILDDGYISISTARVQFERSEF